MFDPELGHLDGGVQCPLPLPFLTSALYIRMSPWLTLDHEGTALMFHSWLECSGKGPVFIWRAKGTSVNLEAHPHNKLEPKVVTSGVKKPHMVPLKFYYAYLGRRRTFKCLMAFFHFAVAAHCWHMWASLKALRRNCWEKQRA